MAETELTIPTEKYRETVHIPMSEWNQDMADHVVQAMLMRAKHQREKELQK